MLALILPFLRANWRIVAAVLILTSAYAFARHQGAESIRKGDERRIAQVVKHTAQREVKAQAITDASSAELDAQRHQIHDLTLRLQARAKLDVPKVADDRCVVNLGFVRAHDAAAEGNPPGVPGPAGGPLDAASGVPLSAVLETVEGNYGIAYDWRAEVMAWRSWYRAQKAAWEKK